ncbi:MAG: hypothetical protein RL431_1045, partial [Actinomycetota bacterium]
MNASSATPAHSGVSASIDTSAAVITERAAQLVAAMAERVVISDGAMGTMLQEANPSMEDYRQLEGCNEILNVTRPDIIRRIHDAYLDTGVDCLESNTFGANWSNLSDYGIEDRIEE